MDNKLKLAPCPFCGSSNVWLHDLAGWETGCSDCGANGPPPKVGEMGAAITLWNGRVTKKPESQEQKNAAAITAIKEMLAKQAQKRADLIAAGKCPDCEGEGEQGGQFCGGNWTCETCNGTGKPTL